VDEIKNQAKYILCTRSKSQHRKAIEVCHKCQHRQHCDDYRQSQLSDRQPELMHALNALMLHVDRNNIPLEDLGYFKKELEELAALFRH
jgi:uncharacterized protein YbgA (DUF1722 family)